MDTPLSFSVLAFRHSLLSKGLLRGVSSLTGWRLQFNGVTLDDAAPLHTLSLPPGALICTISVHDSHEIVFAPPSFDGINAAIVPPVNNAIYFRSIERSKVSPTQPAAEIPESTFASELAQPRGPEVKEAEYDYFPILHRPGYYMVPSHFDMASKSQTEVASLEGFTVGHEGVGEICWEGITDACYLNLDHRVVIEKDLHGVPYVQLYPPELYLRPMPPVGCELNKRAVVRLFNMYPMTLRSDEGMARYEEMLRRMVESMGGEWIGYNRENAILEFRVEHFLTV